MLWNTEENKKTEVLVLKEEKLNYLWKRGRINEMSDVMIETYQEEGTFDIGRIKKSSKN